MTSRLPVSGIGYAAFAVRIPRVGRAVRAACLTFACVLSSNSVSADPVRLVAIGFLGSGGDDTGFFAVGSGFSVGTGALPAGAGPVVTCDPCTPGTSVDLSSTVTIANWGAGSATIDGQTWTHVFYSGSLLFDAGSVIVPEVQPQPPGLDGTIIVSRSSDFTFTGTLNGFADASLSGAPLFSIQLAGGGTSPFGAVAGFGNLGEGTFLDYADYMFTDVAATPEPGSLLLFGSGAAWMAARWRRRQLPA